MTKMNINWPVEERFKIIENFIPQERPSFEDGNEDAFRFTLWNLYTRIIDAIHSAMLLYKNGRYNDAFIIAGHALETTAILSYIKDHNTDEAQRKYYNSYMASMALGSLTANLELSKDMTNDISWLAFEAFFKIFYPIGTYILKEGKDYKDVIKKIHCRELSNSEKIKLLNKNFKPIQIGEYIKALSDNFANKDDGQFKIYYTKYCRFKHSNMLTPGIAENNNAIFEMDDMSYLILGILAYLKTSKPLA